jgi:hypothetical protein
MVAELSERDAAVDEQDVETFNFPVNPLNIPRAALFFALPRSYSLCSI